MKRSVRKDAVPATAARAGRVFAAAVVLACLWLPGGAQASKEPWEEYDKLVKDAGVISPHGAGVLGDDISLQNGGLSFRVTDVSLRGNDALPVEITRTFATKTLGMSRGGGTGPNALDGAMGDWEIDLPHVGGVFAIATGWINPAAGLADKRCAVANASQARAAKVSVGFNHFLAHEIWQGTRLNLPGRGSRAMLVRHAGSPQPTAGGAYWITSDWTSVACLGSIQNGTGEGFLATDASGNKYYLNWMAVAAELPLSKPKPGAAGYDKVSRGRHALYASRIEDRFGNSVDYTYDNAADAPVRLTRIDASDGRSIVLSYVGGRVHTVTANGRTWTYGYNNGSLSSVQLPGTNGAWAINLTGFHNLPIRYFTGAPDEAWRNCGNPGDIVEQTFVGTIGHPSGVVGSFTVQPTRFTRSGIDYATNCAIGEPSDPNDDTEWYPTAWDAYAVTAKTLSGPALAAMSWSYRYGEGYFTEVTGPGDFSRYSFGNTFRVDEGKLLRVQRGSGPTALLSRVDTAYELAQSGLPFPTPIGVSGVERSANFGDEYPRPEKTRTIVQDGVSFVAATQTFDAFARPLGVVRSSSLGYSRTEATTYHDHLAKWILGQVATQSTNGVQSAKTDYDANAMPWKIWAFGKPQQTLTYDTVSAASTGQRGTLKTVADGRSYVTTLSSWYRGIPSSIRYPATDESPSGATQSAAVDDNGWIEEISDENGYKTCYTYDTMGRLASITHPSEAPDQNGVCDTSTWAVTTQTFAPYTAGARYGIPAGHWQHTVSTGNARKVTYFDALWRPLVEENFDNANAAGTRSVTVKRYDSSGRLAFQSYPVRTLGSYTDATLKGARTEYDALDRVTAVKQDSEHGVLTTETTYLSGFRRQTKNPRGHVAIESFQAWDTPAYDAPVRIDAPEGVTTVIARDGFGKPEQITRSGPEG